MINRHHQITALLLCVLASWLSAVAGCGKGNPVAQVRGKVVFKNGTMPNAGIRFIRLECAADTNAMIRKGASGQIDENGMFELYTRRPGDGVHHGKYAVTFAFYRGAMDQRSLVPKKYTSAATTPYQIVVDSNRDDLSFEIEPVAPTTAKSRD